MSETIQTTQNPPKRVDEIMTEINQFDPTILTSPSFQFGAPNIQPEEIKTTINNHRNYQDNSETGQVSKYIITSHLSKIDDYNSEIDQQDSIKVLVGNSTENITLDSDPQGPPPVPKGGAPPSAVYYPPGQLYSADSQQSDVIISQGSTEDRKKSENINLDDIRLSVNQKKLKSNSESDDDKKDEDEVKIPDDTSNEVQKDDKVPEPSVKKNAHRTLNPSSSGRLRWQTDRYRS